MLNSYPIGVLLLNLGTPATPDIKSVRKYLAKFLADKRVIDLPWLLRQLLLYGFILPFRPKVSAKAYQQIWTAQGSPLLVHNLQLCEKLEKDLGQNYCLSLGMSYGQPSIRNAIHLLREKNCQEIIVLPLFPQYSSAATGTALEKCLAILKEETHIPSLTIINHFYDRPEFIEAWKQVINTYTLHFKPNMWLFSYHGLPVNQLTKVCNQSASCLQQENCLKITTTDVDYLHTCYRQQCFSTTHLLAQALGLSSHQYRTAFQSRLGRTPWITPYTDQLLAELIQQGVKNLAVVCPSFVADCLETLEEIGIRAKKIWHSLGGDCLTVLPCLNSHPIWVKGLGQIIRTYRSSPESFA